MGRFIKVGEAVLIGRFELLGLQVMRFNQIAGDAIRFFRPKARRPKGAEKKMEQKAALFFHRTIPFPSKIASLRREVMTWFR